MTTSIIGCMELYLLQILYSNSKDLIKFKSTIQQSILKHF